MSQDDELELRMRLSIRAKTIGAVNTDRVSDIGTPASEFTKTRKPKFMSKPWKQNLPAGVPK